MTLANISGWTDGQSSDWSRRTYSKVHVPS